MNITRKIFGGLALSGAMLAATAVGFSQQPQTGGDQTSGKPQMGRHFGRRGGARGETGFGHFASLNLTDAQKAQLQQIAAKYRESAKSLHRQMRAADGNFKQNDPGTFDENAVRSAAQTRANALVELEVARARMRSEMYNVLTPDQKAQLAAERQQWQQRMQERKARRNATSGATANPSK